MDLPWGSGAQGRHGEKVGSAQGCMKTPRISAELIFPSINFYLFDSHISTYMNVGESLGGLCFLLDTALKTNVCGLTKCK